MFIQPILLNFRTFTNFTLSIYYIQFDLLIILKIINMKFYCAGLIVIGQLF